MFIRDSLQQAGAC